MKSNCDNTMDWVSEPLMSTLVPENIDRMSLNDSSSVGAFSLKSRSSSLSRKLSFRDEVIEEMKRSQEGGVRVWLDGV